MEAPEITEQDFVRFLTENGFADEDASPEDLLDDVKVWMKESGITSDLLSILGASFQANFAMRILIGESFSEALHNMGLTAFQVGWMASKEFGRCPS